MKKALSPVIAALISAGVMIALSAALKDQSVAFAIGMAIFVALGGLSSRRGEQ